MNKGPEALLEHGQKPEMKERLSVRLLNLHSLHLGKGKEPKDQTFSASEAGVRQAFPTR